MPVSDRPVLTSPQGTANSRRRIPLTEIDMTLRSPTMARRSTPPATERVPRHALDGVLWPPPPVLPGRLARNGISNPRSGRSRPQCPFKRQEPGNPSDYVEKNPTPGLARCWLCGSLRRASAHIQYTIRSPPDDVKVLRGRRAPRRSRAFGCAENDQRQFNKRRAPERSCLLVGENAVRKTKLSLPKPGAFSVADPPRSVRAPA